MDTIDLTDKVKPFMKRVDNSGSSQSQECPGGSRVSLRPDPPFYNIESTEQFVELLIEEIFTFLDLCEYP